jgi:hypothetical protein
MPKTYSGKIVQCAHCGSRREVQGMFRLTVQGIGRPEAGGGVICPICARLLLTIDIDPKNDWPLGYGWSDDG